MTSMQDIQNKYFLDTAVKPFIWISILYGAIYFLNNWLTSFLYLVPGAHLVHLPTGFKLLFVLISGWIGALSIGLVAFIYGFFFMFKGDIALDMELACIGALAPYLTYIYFKNKFDIQKRFTLADQEKSFGHGICLRNIKQLIKPNGPVLERHNDRLFEWNDGHVYW